MSPRYTISFDLKNEIFRLHDVESTETLHQFDVESLITAVIMRRGILRKKEVIEIGFKEGQNVAFFDIEPIGEESAEALIERIREFQAEVELRRNLKQSVTDVVSSARKIGKNLIREGQGIISKLSGEFDGRIDQQNVRDTAKTIGSSIISSIIRPQERNTHSAAVKIPIIEEFEVKEKDIVISDNLTIRVKVYSPEEELDDSPIVFLHGFGMNKLVFEPLVESFKASYQVVTFDHRGHGESGEAKSYKLDDYVSDLTKILDSLKIDCCHLICHSLGAIIALAFIRKFPHRVETISMLAPFVCFDRLKIELENLPKPFIWNDLTRDQLSELLSQYFLPDGAPAILNEGSELFDVDDKIIQDTLEEMNTFAEEVAKLTEQKIEGIPSIALLGLDDPLFSETSELLQGSNIKVIPIRNSSHFIPLEQPEAVLKMLERFLRGEN